MFKSVWKCLLAFLLAATPLLAAQNAVIVPLLPDDDGQKVTFTKDSFEKLLDTNKTKPAAAEPRLAGLIEPTSLDNSVAVSEALSFLLNPSPMGSMVAPGGTSYMEGAAPSGGMITFGGWPWQAGGTAFARSTYGEIGMALLAAYAHHPKAGLLYSIQEMAKALAADYTGNGPLAGTHKPFMPDIVFLGEFHASGLKDASDATNYLTVAQNWFAVLTAVRNGTQEVDRIVAARAAQGVPELSGYDIGWLYSAADLVGNTTFRDAVAARLTALSGSWEVTYPQDNTANMLSRALLICAGIGDASWPAFLAGTQQTTAGVMNGFDSNGSFLPSGNIQSNSWIILALKNTAGYYGKAVKGVRYLLETQMTGGAWYSYPLFGGTDIYPNEVAAALWAFSETAYQLSIPTVKDRENSVSLGNIAIKLTGESGDTTLKMTSAGAVTFYALLDTNLTVSYPIMLGGQDASLPGDKISSFDASLVLEQAIKTTPFGSSSKDYGAAAGALHAANLGKSGSFTNSSVNSQIAAEILRFAVGNSPQYTPVYFDLNRISGTALKDTAKVFYDHSGAMTLAAVNLVLLGDISNNFGAGGGFSTTLLASTGNVSPFSLSLLDYIESDGKLAVPVTLAGIRKGLSAPRSFQYDLSYDKSLVEFKGFSPAENLGSFLYALNSSQEGLVRVAMASGQPLTADGVIGYLEFTLKEIGARPGFGLSNVTIDERNARGESVIFSASMAGNAELPKVFNLSQNSPNPFNPSTTIRYSIPADSDQLKVKLDVFNLRGQLVQSLVDMFQGPGDYVVNWDGRDLTGQSVPSGVYFYRIQAGSYSQVRKMIILK